MKIDSLAQSRFISFSFPVPKTNEDGQVRVFPPSLSTFPRAFRPTRREASPLIRQAKGNHYLIFFLAPGQSCLS